jgi:hypothetical protein
VLNIANSETLPGALKKMKIGSVSHLVFILGLIALLCGCGGSTLPPAPAVTDVFVAGFVENNNGSESAIYWKNGAATILPDLGHSSEAHAIAVSGNDVYVAGIEGNGTQDLAVYWKNGAPVVLTDGAKRGFANAIFVTGNDVYVAGGENGIAEYWKNGAPVALTDGIFNAQANSITVSGADVYVAGFQNKTTVIDPLNLLTVQVAKYWKNGVPVELTTGLEPANAFSIFVSGPDVYVAGFENHTLPGGGVAKYWKNGLAMELSGQNTFASSIVVSGTNVFVAGNDERTGEFAETWINGTPHPLNSAGNTSNANQLAISGTDVYVAGGEGPTAKYWKNGTPVALTDGKNFATAMSIAVVGH